MSEENITVVGMKTLNHKGKVYDLNVEDEHNYVVSDALVHNSAAGSEICYLTDITGIDPLKNKLMFERFLNPSRFNYPDIDMDIQSYIGSSNTLGKDALIKNLSYKRFPFSGQIVNEMRASTITLFKKLANAMDIPFKDANKVSTDSEVSEVYLMEDTYTGWLQSQLEKINIPYDYKWQELEKHIEFCYRFGGNGRGDNAQGLLWNTSIHASGVIFYPDNNKNILPKSSQGVTYRGHALESMGFIKYDILSLDALNPISHFMKRIEEDTGKPFDWEDNSDPETWETFKRADTDFVFQFASAGMKRALRTIQPESIDVLAELNSLYRPGCIKAGIFERYLHDDWTDEEKVVGEFLKEEFGEQHSYAMIFQEDIMKVVEKMAGFSLADADLVRRAMQRKEKKTMDSYRQQFLDGFDKEKYGDIAITVWDTIDAFATYTFNKSHSVAYSCIAYWTAYIFTHYKNEYLEYLLGNGKDKQEIIKYLSKDHKIIYPSLKTKNTNYIVTDEELYLPTASVQEDDSIIKYLLNLDADKNKMIVKFGILDDFCIDRKNVRDMFKTLDKKRVKALTESQIEGLESDNILDMIKKMAAVDLLDYELIDGGKIRVLVKKAKSEKEFIIKTRKDQEILKHNCQEDVRAYGIVRDKYCDAAPEVPIEDITELMRDIFDDPDKDNRHCLKKIVGNNSAIQFINSELNWYNVVCKDSKISGWSNANIVFNNDIINMKIQSKELANFFKTLDKNEPLEIRCEVDVYLNRDGDVAYSMKIVEATNDGGLTTHK